MFPVTHTRVSVAEALEDLGTKARFWYPDGDDLILDPEYPGALVQPYRCLAYTIDAVLDLLGSYG